MEFKLKTINIGKIQMIINLGIFVKIALILKYSTTIQNYVYPVQISMTVIA
jgi:hypothetical protein